VMRLRSVNLCLFMLGLSLAALSRESMAETVASPLRAGAYAQDITPPRFPISVNGNMVDQLATAAHDPLHARCVVLRNATTSMAIVVCDSCAIPRDLMDRAKALASSKTGIPTSHILISATHAHSCPTVTAVFQSEPDSEYVEFLIEQIARGIEHANNQLEPARVGWGSVEEKSLLFNRRWMVKSDETVDNPFGSKSDRVVMNPGFANPKVSKSINLIDPELSFLAIQSSDGRPIALLANYSLHYIGGVTSDVVSADYFGEFAQRIARQLKATDVQPPFVGIMSNGTSADVNNVDFRQVAAPRREPFEQIAYAAELLAQDVARAYEKIDFKDSLPLKVTEREIVVGVRKPIEDEVKAAERKLEAAAEGPLKELPLVYARETTLLAQYPTSVRIKLQAFRIGSLGIATSPCETFTETGLAIKKNSALKHTFTISLANGYNGYLPTPEQQLLGGYETWRARSSYLAADAEPKIRSTMLGLLSEANK
jgi:neutral ceramidase